VDLFSEQRCVLDRSIALARVGGDAELLKEIADLFLTEYPGTLANLAEALNRGDAKAVERTAHSLKGSVANFGAGVAVETAAALEQSGRAGDLNRAPQLLYELERILSDLQAELAAL
jgi:HPt (histidine-containing phosphotransfer) domain-containing protein